MIPGDGIGTEVTAAARSVLDAAAARHRLELAYEEFDWSCRRYAETGAMMPADGIDRLRAYDAILLGAVGWPGVPDHVSLWGLLIPIRRAFRQYVNLRPIRVFDGVDSPLRGRGRAGGLRRGPGERRGRVQRDRRPDEPRLPGRARGPGSGVHPRRGDPDRRLRVRVGRLAQWYVTSATKSNGIVHTLPFWDEVVAERAARFPEVRWDSEQIDALAAKVVLEPGRFDVIVASNLFGDILSDLAAAVAGSIGIAPSANLDPTRTYPSMFEPVHGSAPDIAGKGVANPIGAVWSAAMMLDHLGHEDAADHLMGAVRSTLRDPGTRTRDLRGTASTDEVALALDAALRSSA